MDVSELKGRKIGRVLTKLGVVTREQVHEALQVQKSRTQKVLLGALLVELGYCTQRDVDRALAGQAGMEFIDLAKMTIPEETLAAIPAENARAYQVVPIKWDPVRKQLRVAMKSASNFQAVDDLRLLLGAKVEAAVAPADAIDAVIAKHYAREPRGRPPRGRRISRRSQ